LLLLIEWNILSAGLHRCCHGNGDGAMTYHMLCCHDDKQLLGDVDNRERVGLMRLVDGLLSLVICRGSDVHKWM